MQTLYYTTDNLIRPADKVIYLEDYRTRCQPPEDETARRYRADEERPAGGKKTRRQGGKREATFAAWLLDIGASLAVMAMTVAFTVQHFC